MPPIGKVLNPFHGLWQRPMKTKLSAQEISMPGLKGLVHVTWDEDQVAHILSDHWEDLYRAQGYVHASHRLFQMDLQARAGGGRLSELLGKRTLDFDHFTISMGLRETARRTLKAILADERTKTMVEAYVEGVNQKIQELTPSDWPTEYQILDQAPRSWRPLQVAEIFAIMGFRLSGRTFDLQLTQDLKKWGQKKVEALFLESVGAKYEAPFASLPQDGGGEWPAVPKEAQFITQFNDFPRLLKPLAGNGSNNWAVAPSLSRTGTSLLANDTHLGLTLPGIWIEQQLISGEFNVYGGGFAGVPGILVGFNSNVGWAVTNGTTDVTDWYEMPIEESEVSEEVISVRGEEPVVQKMLWTELGPVVQQEGAKGLVLRWTLHDGGNPLRTFLRLNEAKDFFACQESLRDWVAPIQNFICADAKQVGITHAGEIPIRWRDQGRFVMDGKDPKYRWRGTLPFEKWPRTVNPDSGFVGSANQRPIDAKNPFFIGWDSENSYRGRRVFEWLRSQRDFSLEDFMTMQKDSLSILARETMPNLLFALRNLSSEQAEAVASLGTWDFRFELESSAATLFHEWWQTLLDLTWEDQLGVPDEGGVWPNDQRLALLVERGAKGDLSDEEWIDDIRTPEKEDFTALVNRAFQRAWAHLSTTFGKNWAQWRWGDVRKIRLTHVGRFPGFGAELSAPGHKHSLNAFRQGHGPTWRMVVALGAEPVAWTCAAGGPQGDPLARDYRRGLEAWAKGEYKRVRFAGAQDFASLQGVTWNFHR